MNINNFYTLAKMKKKLQQVFKFYFDKLLKSFKRFSIYEKMQKKMIFLGKTNVKNKNINQYELEQKLGIKAERNILCKKSLTFQIKKLTTNDSRETLHRCSLCWGRRSRSINHSWNITTTQEQMTVLSVVNTTTNHSLQSYYN